jgi:ribose 5-phosphate isomerase A
VDLAERLTRLAVAAADLVEPGMTVGLGTGSTADAVLRELGRRAADGLIFTGVATSLRTETLARELGIPLVSLETVDRLDLGYDGADEIAPNLDAIKGRGGALLHEKLVALASDRYVLVATTEKCVDILGEHTPLPVEIVSFGWRQTAARLGELGILPTLRQSAEDSDRPFRTDNGGYILECGIGPIADPLPLAAAIKATSGVVDHGLFLGIATEALLVASDGETFSKVRPGL